MFLHEPRIRAYLCQVLHVIDFNLKREPWDKWLSLPFSRWITEWQEQTAESYQLNLPDSAIGRPDFAYPFREWMQHWSYWQQPPGTQPVVEPITFLDSGGFALMKLSNFKKAEALEVSETPEFIFDLQRKQGGDLIASLDRPVPPGLSADEVRNRQEWSITNAVAMLNLLAMEKENPVVPGQAYTPFPYVAVHGDSVETGQWYVDEFFRRWQSDELLPSARNVPFGFAIGSMVPRADDPRVVVEIVWGIIEAIHAHQPILDDAGLPAPPVHVFGINSHLTALLSYLGVDTFDSSTFADVAKRANYLREDLRPVRISEVTHDMLRQCNCYVCEGLIRAHDQGVDVLNQMTRILGQKVTQPDGNGDTPQNETPEAEKPENHYYHRFSLPGFPGRLATRSDIYALIAMHNWERLTQETDKIQKYAAQGRLSEHLIEMVIKQDAQRGERLTDALLWMAAAEARAGRPELLAALPGELRIKAEAINPDERRSAPVPKVKEIWTPDMFDLRTNHPYAGRPPEKPILLLMACSKGKPYRDSAHQRLVLEAIHTSFPHDHHKIHKVTFSGLFGPVPEEFEDDPDCVINRYDYKLEEGNADQASELSDRLEAYLKQNKYDTIVAYIYFPAYRAVVEGLKDKYRIKVLPEHPKRGGKTVRYREELLKYMEYMPGFTRAGRIEQMRLDV
ncbi:MAG TPA: DUF5591 domain-containing protein [Symbiobacteriaceae bacterium]|nr:DUF5591 domain-containing protein [Symbiobacteriaceae bacterium]